MMIWIDYTFLIIIGGSSFVSLIRGFVKEALSLVIWVSAFFIASTFYPNLAVLLTNIHDEFLRNAAASGILFVCTLILGALINYLVAQLVTRTGLSGTDRVLGLVFGGLRGILIITALLFFMDSFTGASSTSWWKDSILITEFQFIVEWFFEFLKQTSTFLRQI